MHKCCPLNVTFRYTATLKSGFETVLRTSESLLLNKNLTNHHGSFYFDIFLELCF